MTNQEKWDQIVQRISDLGDELQEIFDSLEQDDPERSERIEDIESALMGLRMSVDHLEEQEIPE